MVVVGLLVGWLVGGLLEVGGMMSEMFSHARRSERSTDICMYMYISLSLSLSLSLYVYIFVRIHVRRLNGWRSEVGDASTRSMLGEVGGRVRAVANRHVDRF